MASARWGINRILCAVAALIVAPMAASGQDIKFRTYQDVAGFTCEFPEGWNFQQSKKGDRVFFGPRDTAAETTIIIQVIDRSLTTDKTAKAQLDALTLQLKKIPRGRILTQGMAPIANQQAPFVIASYDTTDSTGRLRKYRHIQSVVTAPNVFLLMSYSAPDETFDEHLKVFQHASVTLKLTSAVPAPPVAGKSDIPVWYRNADRDFWMPVPATWTQKQTPGDVYTIEMKHPDRVEGVIVWVVKLPKTTKVKDWADAWEAKVASDIFFMEKRLAQSELTHKGVGITDTPSIVREYQGQIKGATVRSVAVYVTHKRLSFTAVGYHFLGDEEGAKRVQDAVLNLRLAAPD